MARLVQAENSSTRILVATNQFPIAETRCVPSLSMAGSLRFFSDPTITKARWTQPLSRGDRMISPTAEGVAHPT